MLKNNLANLVNTELEIINSAENEIVFKGYFKNPDYSKLEKINNYTITDLQEIFIEINRIIHYDPNVGAKFERSAEEIISSGTYNGCSDFAIVFRKYAKDKGIPTVHLVTADIQWIKDLNTNIPPKGYNGHHFCECYISNKWILVDPIRNKIYENYDKTNFIINPNSRTNCYIYAKCATLEELLPYMQIKSNMEKSHNTLMKELFTNFDLNKLSTNRQYDIEI